jgi:cobalt-zinc-cadmium efflux system protein
VKSQNHDHGMGTAAAQERDRLAWVLGITIALVAAEVIGGVLAHSLALLADAGHMAADGAGVGLSLLAIWFATRPASGSRTFGYQRAEILAAVVNAVVLFGVGASIVVAAALQLAHPVSARPGVMAAFAVAAIAGNGASMLVLRHGRSKSLNVRAALVEVLSDFLSALAVVIAALVIAASGYQRANAIVAILIGLLILPRTVKLLRDAVDVLLEATPRGVDLAEIRGHICDTSGVLDVHDLHVWTITSGIPVISAHVVVDDAWLADGGGGRVLDRLAECLGGHFDVAHCTFQLEPSSHRAHERSVHE